MYKWENAYIKESNAWRFFVNFICIYFADGNGGEGVNSSMYMYGKTLSESNSISRTMLDYIICVSHKILAKEVGGGLNWSMFFYGNT